MITLRHVVSRTISEISFLKEVIELTEAQGVDEGEREHIELCMLLIQAECEYLLTQADIVPEMSELL